MQGFGEHGGHGRRVEWGETGWVLVMGVHARTERSRVTLDREDIEAVARRVVEILGDQRPMGLVDAATMAKLLGVSRATVYAKADELGAVRVGGGKRARLRFDAARLTMQTLAGNEVGSTRAGQGRRRPRTTKAHGADQDLLPIRGGEAAGAVP